MPFVRALFAPFLRRTAVEVADAPASLAAPLKGSARREWVEAVFGPYLPRHRARREEAIAALSAAEAQVWDRLHDEVARNAANGTGQTTMLIRSLVATTERQNDSV